MLEDLPSLNESEASSGPLLSAMVRRMTSKLPNLPKQNLNDKYPKNILPEQMSLCQKLILFLEYIMVTMCLCMERQTLGGLKEDFTKADVLGNDSVRRILDFDKTSTSFPPVGDKRLTVGTSEASTTTNVNR